MGRGGAAVAGRARQCDCGTRHLTAREIEVLRLAAMGLSGNQIATYLRISRRTVEDHLSVMRRRAQARDRGELIARSYAAEILVGWPPRWSGTRCLVIRQRPECQSPDVQAAQPVTAPVAAAAWLVSENPHRNQCCSITSHHRFLDTSGGMVQAQADHGGAVQWHVGLSRATGMLIGYARASIRDKHLTRQIDALRAVGCHTIFADKEPGKNSERRELRRLLDAARPGDVLVVASLDRLSRSLRDLIPLIAELRGRSVELKTLRESLDTTAPCGRLIFDVFAALTEFLREIIIEGTREGLASHAGASGRPTVMTAEKITEARALLPETSIAAIARQIGISRSTLYAHMDAITEG